MRGLDGSRARWAGAGLALALAGCCEECDREHVPVYEAEPKVVELEEETAAAPELGQDAPSVKGTLTMGGGGGVLLDFELKNDDPEYKLDKLFVYSGNYQQADGSDIPAYPDPPPGGTWVATKTLSRVPGPHTEKHSFFAPAELYDPANPKIWAFLSVYLIHDDGSQQQRRRQYYHFWRDDPVDETPVPPSYHVMVPADLNPVSKSGPVHTW